MQQSPVATIARAESPAAGDAPAPEDHEAGVSIRPYRPADREAVREIAWETAFFGSPAGVFFEERGLLEDLLTSYHTEVEPESALIAEAGGEVVGYLTACTRPADQRRFVRRAAPRWAVRFLHALLFRPRMRRFVLATLKDLAAGRLSEPAGLEREYPAQLHFNVRAAWRGRGVGTRLHAAALERLAGRGIPGVRSRLTVFEEDAAILRLKRRSGFRVVDEKVVRCWVPFVGRPARVVYMVRRLDGS